jgi:hypothetical protein
VTFPFWATKQAVGGATGGKDLIVASLKKPFLFLLIPSFIGYIHYEKEISSI